MTNTARKPLSLVEPSLSARIQATRDETRRLVLGHIEAFESALIAAYGLAAEIAEGGDLYPVGIREIGRFQAENLPKTALTVRALMERER